jgi:hypothetical protein
MGDNNTYSIMLFVLGLFLLGIGIYLYTYYQVVSVSFSNPFYMFIDTPQPYRNIGLVMIIVGVILAIGALISSIIRTRKKPQQ